MPAQKKFNINPNRNGYAINRNADSKRRFEQNNSKYKPEKNCNLTGPDIKRSGAVCLEMELMVVEINREITNVGKQGDEFHNETEYK